jgi:L-malate glycosyltransferase
VLCLERRAGFDWRCVRRLSRMCRQMRVDLVHAHQYTPFAYAVAAGVCGRRPPVLFSEHGRFFPDSPSRKRKIFNRLMYRSCDRFVAVGNSVRQALIDNEGLPSNRIEVIYNGVNVLSAKSGTAARMAIRAELGASNGDIVVLNVARLDPIKDHQTAVRAIGIASRRNPAIRMFIAGDGPERAAIEQAVREQHLENRVKLLGMRHDIGDLLCAADVFLLTSVSEGVPVTVLESMAAGIPVIATNVGGLPEVVTDRKTGLLAPTGDAACLADALLLLAENSEMRSNLAIQAKHRLTTDFLESKMLAGYDRVYAEMLSTRMRHIRATDSPNPAEHVGMVTPNHAVTSEFGSST